MQQAEWQLQKENVKRTLERINRQTADRIMDYAKEREAYYGSQDKQVEKLKKEAAERRGEKDDRKPDDKKDKKKEVSELDIRKQQLKTDLLKIAKEHKMTELQDAQRIEKYWSERLQEEGQKLDGKYTPLINKYQERAQMAQSEADREYEQRIIEYIQRMYQAEKELIDKELKAIGKVQQEREKGNVSTDKISNLQVETKAAMDKCDDSEDELDKMVKEHKKQQEDMKKTGHVDKTEDKKEEKKEEKKADKKTMDISGLKNVDNSKLDAGDLKDKKEKKKKSFLGL